MGANTKYEKYCEIARRGHNAYDSNTWPLLPQDLGPLLQDLWPLFATPRANLTDPSAHVLFRWEHWSEEAYEGWGWGNVGVVNDAGAASAPSSSAVAEDVGRGNSTFGGMFRRPGVVYPIHPTGHMRLPRPKLPFKQDGTGGEEGRVTFVVQVRPCDTGGGCTHGHAWP